MTPLQANRTVQEDDAGDDAGDDASGLDSPLHSSSSKITPQNETKQASPNFACEHH
jgi:hypothetical protein